MSGILNTIQDVAGKLGKTFQSVLDMTFPPEKRAEVLSKLQEFAVNNPKLAVCLAYSYHGRIRSEHLNRG